MADLISKKIEMIELITLIFFLYNNFLTKQDQDITSNVSFFLSRKFIYIWENVLFF